MDRLASQCFETNQGWSVLATVLVSVLEASGGLGNLEIHPLKKSASRSSAQSPNMAADSSSASTPCSSIVQVKRRKGGPQSRGSAAVQASGGATTVASALVMLKAPTTPCFRFGFPSRRTAYRYVMPNNTQLSASPTCFTCQSASSLISESQKVINHKR
jgi:hypothetical protein